MVQLHFLRPKSEVQAGLCADRESRGHRESGCGRAHDHGTPTAPSIFPPFLNANNLYIIYRTYEQLLQLLADTWPALFSGSAKEKAMMQDCCSGQFSSCWISGLFSRLQTNSLAWIAKICSENVPDQSPGGSLTNIRDHKIWNVFVWWLCAYSRVLATVPMMVMERIEKFVSGEEDFPKGNCMFAGTGSDAGTAGGQASWDAGQISVYPSQSCPARLLWLVCTVHALLLSDTSFHYYRRSLGI